MDQFCVTIHHPITAIVLLGSERDSAHPINQPLQTILHDTDSGIVLNKILVGSSAHAFIQNRVINSNDPGIGLQFLEYLDGKRKQFTGFQIDLEHQTDFTMAVLAAAAKIPYGAQISYSELAASAGFPKAVRAAASVMRNNRFPLVMPCHRVISKSGKSGAYCGSNSGKDADLKRELIALEAKSFQSLQGK